MLQKLSSMTRRLTYCDRLHQWCLQIAIPHIPHPKIHVPGCPRGLGRHSPNPLQLHLRHGRFCRIQRVELFRKHADRYAVSLTPFHLASLETPPIHTYELSRKHRLRRPRRIGPTPQPALPLGEIQHRHRLLLRRLLFLLASVSAPEPAEAQHNGIFLLFPDAAVLRGVCDGRYGFRAQGRGRQTTA